MDCVLHVTCSKESSPFPDSRCFPYLCLAQLCWPVFVQLYSEQPSSSAQEIEATESEAKIVLHTLLEGVREK